jgi:hypothetical protein
MPKKPLCNTTKKPQIITTKKINKCKKSFEKILEKKSGIVNVVRIYCPIYKCKRMMASMCYGKFARKYLK